ncbi:SAS complex subunit [Lithohypha guttulata]|uniref:histone acetyltransferase n=1 Tax=Lithohypha guttulata TaxID=1690604 RepID=A0AAN7SVP9_9EURO|nr:SAS complex subunit [Lithohypha guttulata]KAK5082114.1 SAS complex subunit [Lithohypha guttulata]
MPEALDHDIFAIKPPGSPSHTRRASLKILSRNIDKVVLGTLLFDTWYFSPYPESVLFGHDHHSSKASLNGDARNGHLEKTIVPPCHVQDLEANPETWWPVPKTALKVYDWDGYTVWDVDGEQEKLYCQNLSLYAKLFLEQKSVFFDTSGFHYFVLTYTPPSNTASSGLNKNRVRGRRSSGSATDLGLKTQVMGFFSKENLSWDANNLACILVFPPFQHRNLGQLLMAVSYKLSGWEWEDSIIGGPEKPLSLLGRKSYLRFWSERIARYFMGQSADADGQKIFGGPSKSKASFAKEEMTVRDIGERTGMLPEDVIAALNEMKICAASSRKCKKTTELQEADRIDEVSPATMLVKRSQILAWATRNDIDLAGPVKEEGFLGEWALSDSGSGTSESAGSEIAST